MTLLTDRLARGDVILMDGATGTELERRGVPMNAKAWTAAALSTHPDVVRQIHEDYIRAGADIIITNTFSTSRHLLAAAGLADQFKFLNANAVQVAREAREAVADRPVFVAASISTTTMEEAKPPLAQAQINFTDQAEILAEAGADLIILEMMRDIDYTRAALHAAARTGLPVWIGFSCVVEGDGSILLWDKQETLTAGLAATAGEAGSLALIMHTLTEDTTPALQVLKENWSGPLGAYAHSGEFIMPNWQFIDMISPSAYAAEARQWVEMGVQVIGGCCGIGPEHIRVLKDHLPTHIPITQVGG